MASNTDFRLKYFEEDLELYRDMIKSEESFIEVLEKKRKDFPSNVTLQEDFDECISNSLENIWYYTEKINKLLGL